MVHERDEKYEGQEDGEYHFSDDQANYDMEPEETAQPVAEKATTKSLSTGVKQYRRPLIGVAVFAVLIFLVYKITAPATTQAPGDFAQGAAATTPASKTVVLAKPADTTAQSAFQPLSPPLGMSGSSSSGAAQQPVTAHLQAPAPAETVAQASPSSVPAADQSMISNVAEQPAPSVVVGQSVYNPAHPSADSNGNSMVAEPAEIAMLNQKIAMLTQQDARMQIEYSQKIADYEAQNSALQSKLQDVNMRLVNLETTLAHLGRAVQQDTRTVTLSSNRSSTGMPSQPMMQSSEPKAAYTVSAIIPGRAWLKSEGGETVTVAEGDTLKGYGRIMKSDPYDGVVELDVGGRIVSLSYGATGE